jgi:hypothetical protein
MRWYPPHLSVPRTAGIGTARRRAGCPGFIGPFPLPVLIRWTYEVFAIVLWTPPTIKAHPGRLSIGPGEILFFDQTLRRPDWRMPSVRPPAPGPPERRRPALTVKLGRLRPSSPPSSTTVANAARKPIVLSRASGPHAPEWPDTTVAQERKFPRRHFPFRLAQQR